MNCFMPLTIDIDITNQCNCACIHCNKFPNTPGKELTMEQISILINELYELGVAEISLTGGEPLCRRDWFDIVKSACSYPGLSVILNTNGLLWKNRDINRIKSLVFPPKIAISMDGYSPDTYSALRRYKNGRPAGTAFPFLIKTIQGMKTANIDVCLNYVVTDKTSKWIEKTIKLSETLNVNSFLLLKLMNRGNASKENKPGLSFETWKDTLREITHKKYKGERFYDKVFVSVACPWEILLPLRESGFSLREISKLWGYHSSLMAPGILPSRDVACTAGVLYACITAAGDLIPCSVIPPENIQAHCGNIMDTSFEKIWRDSRVLNSIRGLKLKGIRESLCSVCHLKSSCGGGCRARGFFSSGTFDGPDMECPINSGRKFYE
ncbi:MAG: radical SAM protein [Desulfobacteraceae bacterium]|nr:radical SAM protein [Desulfobacteraceae bacterium]